EEEEATGASSTRGERRIQVILLHFVLASSVVRSSWTDLIVEGLSTLLVEFGTLVLLECRACMRVVGWLFFFRYFGHASAGFVFLSSLMEIMALFPAKKKSWHYIMKWTSTVIC
ncbi:hypothetical protein Q6247_25255, partial [Klebsiella pneumoniae]